MNGAPWMALGAIATAATFGVGLIVHIVRYAYKQGQTDTRLAAIEKGQEGSAELKSVVAALTATVEGLTRAVDRLDGYFENLSTPLPRGRRTKAVDA